jgi:hypothetical protein
VQPVLLGGEEVSYTESDEDGEGGLEAHGRPTTQQNSLTKEAMAAVEAHRTRLPRLPQWFIDIPAPAVWDANLFP